MARLNLFLVTILFLLSACGKTPLYEKVYSFEKNMWEQNVRPEFEVNIENTDKLYDFTLFLRTTTDYKYNNLWVFLKTESPNGTFAREPFELIISNPDGSWAGNKTGTVVETAINFKSRKLPTKGKYKFVIEQGITESKIDEVLDVGFRVEVKDPN